MNIRTIRTADGKGSRVEIVVDDADGERTLTLSAEVAHQASLRPGAVLDERELRALRRADRTIAAREHALRLLAHRARSRAELVTRLRARGFEEEVVDGCMERLDGAGLLDDEAYARAHCRDRVRLRPRGRRALLSELRGKGVAPPLAERVVDEVLAEEGADELDLARDAARRWRPRADDPDGDRRRLYAFLGRRGFTAETAAVVADEVLGG